MLDRKPLAQLTPYQSKYYAYQLTRHCPTDSMEKLAGALVDAQVDLNPHQVEAALFAFRSPLSRGAILADEVGLGKTIEVGFVLSQRWAERKRRILIITPANLRKQVVSGAPGKVLPAKPNRGAQVLQRGGRRRRGQTFFVDDRVFGDLASFREQFSRIANQTTFDSLKARIRPICFRTLRRQVRQYVPYTKRHAILQKFKPGPEESALYDLVSDYLRRDNLQALPSGQRTLMTLVLRKLLASSSFAIAGALETLAKRLKKKLKDSTVVADPSGELAADFESYDELSDEWGEAEPEPISPAERDALVREVAELEDFRDLAVSITENAKGRALLAALKTAFDKADQLGAARKAVVFTESRRTQGYLVRLLEETPYGENLVLFNGTNSDKGSRQIYNAAMLAEAVCKLEGFVYAPSETLYWQHGHSTETDLIYITTQTLSYEQLQSLSDEVGEHRSLLVCCSAFRAKRDAFSNLTLKQIPKAVMERCEWSRDDRSLRVENLPRAPQEPEQGRLDLGREEDWR